jgi:hypothetical protein
MIRRTKMTLMETIMTNAECSPHSGATSSATETAVHAKPCAGELDAVCVDCIDHGKQDTPWGRHPRISLVFETHGKEGKGTPEFLTRTFNNYPYSRSSLTLEIKNWLGRDISGPDEDWDLAECVGIHATLRTSEVVSKAGNHYDKIESVSPGRAVRVEPSGTYRRQEN